MLPESDAAAQLEREALATHAAYSIAFIRSKTKDLNEDRDLSNAYDAYRAARERAGFAVNPIILIEFPPEVVAEHIVSSVALHTGKVLEWLADESEAEGDPATAHFYRYLALKYFQAQEPGDFEEDIEEYEGDENFLEELAEMVRKFSMHSPDADPSGLGQTAASAGHGQEALQ